MPKIGHRFAFSVAAVLLILAADAGAQRVLNAVNEIKLPVPSSLGGFGGQFPFIGEPAKSFSTLKVAPNQSVLSFQPDANGKWLLVRVKQWWTKDPVTEALNIPGWSGADVNFGDLSGVALQIAPGGRYAVASAAVEWRSNGKRGHKFDTLITVVDLERWQIVGSTHTADTEEVSFRGARVLNDHWIALQGLDKEAFAREYSHVYDRHNRLISLPDLKSGPTCISKRPNFLLGARASDAEWRAAYQKLGAENDATCREVLEVSGVPSVKDWESLIYKGHGTMPEVLLLKGNGIADSQEPRLRNAVDRDNSNSDAWSISYYGTNGSELPVESTSHRWYATHYVIGTSSRGYALEVFDADGKRLMSQAPDHLLCAGNGSRAGNGNCVCRVDEVSEEQDTLLTSCRAYSPGLVDNENTHAQWLSVFRSKNLVEVGLVDLSKDKRTVSVIGVGDGHAYVLAVDAGNVLRVYAVPAP